ncbi:MAG: hypothetical protein DMG07_23630 [Acidobacteria bacterium]|nr:MAG: hypothetical protein DMG07_23630 [Acidobacteriota bacterium]
MLSRREAIVKLIQFAAASPLLGAQSSDPLLDTVNVFDFERLAQTKLDKIAWDYLSEGSDDEVSLRDNREAFNRLVLRPRVLTDVHSVHLRLTLLGHKLEFPIFLDPAGGKNCFCPNGELETARAAAASGAMMVTNGGIDAFLASGKGPKLWFQYTTGGQFRTRNAVINFVEKLEDMGAGGICFTVDNMYISHRERSIRNRFVRSWCETGIPRDAAGNLVYKPNDRIWRSGEFSERAVPTPTWDTVRILRDMTDLPVLIKGVLTAEDTELAVRTGMSAVIVSNHGARSLDHVGARGGRGEGPGARRRRLPARHRHPEGSRARRDGRRRRSPVSVGPGLVREPRRRARGRAAAHGAGAGHGNGRGRPHRRHRREARPEALTQ